MQGKTVCIITLFVLVLERSTYYFLKEIRTKTKAFVIERNQSVLKFKVID